ncbi:MAG: HAMP domain-containing protein, partial [Bdellovibrionales bacterium]|nr:HAMP domain-containing protein [Bdellovibrionales bacterium]
MESNGNIETLIQEMDDYKTPEITMEHIIGVCQAAANGDFEARVLHTEGEFELATLGRAINQMLDITDAFIRESRAALQHASQGKYYRRVLLRGLPGTFRHAAKEINLASLEIQRKDTEVKDAEVRRLALADDLEQTIQAVVQTVAS